MKEYLLSFRARLNTEHCIANWQYSFLSYPTAIFPGCLKLMDTPHHKYYLRNINPVIFPPKKRMKASYKYHKQPSY